MQKDNPVRALLTERQAAEYLHCSLSKLQRMRKKGKGPVFIRYGHPIYYRKSDLDAFLEKHSSEAA